MLWLCVKPNTRLAEPHTVIQWNDQLTSRPRGGKHAVLAPALSAYYLFPVHQYGGDVRGYRAGKLLENDSSLAHSQPAVFPDNSYSKMRQTSAQTLRGHIKIPPPSKRHIASFTKQKAVNDDHRTTGTERHHVRGHPVNSSAL